ncbi:MAG: hypothetical protein R3F40_00590 [Candidatus Competibacteraceae bacterium]
MVIADGRDLDAEQVRRGMAWVYRRYSRSRRLYALEAEGEASPAWSVGRPESDPAVGLAAWWKYREVVAIAVTVGLVPVRNEAQLER